jgi:hypothetical protein
LFCHVGSFTGLSSEAGREPSELFSNDSATGPTSPGGDVADVSGGNVCIECRIF